MQSRLIILVLGILLITSLSCPYATSFSTKDLIRQVQLDSMLLSSLKLEQNFNPPPQIFSHVKDFELLQLITGLNQK